uniref:Uncharacterized protein n=1 Tax=Oryza punctata TaxID=4537 RepID=A0A0E0L170_ORYPU
MESGSGIGNDPDLTLGCDGGREGAPPNAGAALNLCFFLVVLLVFLGLSWYMRYELAAERFADQVRLVLMVSPLALLLSVRLLSGCKGGGSGRGRRGVDQLQLSLPMPDRDSIHRVGVLLVLLVVMAMTPT